MNVLPEKDTIFTCSLCKHDGIHIDRVTHLISDYDGGARIMAKITSKCPQCGNSWCINYAGELDQSEDAIVEAEQEFAVFDAMRIMELVS